MSYKVLRKASSPLLVIPLAMAALTGLAADDAQTSQSSWQKDSALTALQDPSAEVQYAALEWLSRRPTLFVDQPLTVSQATLMTRYLRPDVPAETRSIAAQFLGAQEATAATFAPQLAAAMKDPDPQVRLAGAEGLVLAGPASAAYLPQLIEVLRHDTDADVRQKAANTLAAIGPLSSEFRSQLADLLTDPDPKVRLAGTWTLAELQSLDSAFPSQLTALLKDPDAQVRMAALTIVSGTVATARSADSQASPALSPNTVAALVRQGVALLQDSNPEVRSQAVETVSALASSGPAAGLPAGAAAGLLLKLSQDPDTTVRERAIGALFGMEPAGPVFTRQVSALLKDPNADVRSTVLQYVGMKGSNLAALAPQVLKMMADPETTVRSAAAGALIRLGMIPQVSRLLDSPSASIREAVLQSLAGTTHPAAALMPHIITLLKHPDPTTRLWASEVLVATGKLAVYHSLLAQLLRDPDFQVRATVLQNLGALATDAAVFVPDVRQLEDASDPNTRTLARQVLIRMLPAADFRQQVSDLLADTDSEMRTLALAVIAEKGAAGAELAPQVAKLLKDRQTSVRVMAVRTLASLGPAAAAYARQIAPLMADADQDVRQAALYVLDDLSSSGALQDPAVFALCLGAAQAQGPQAAALLLRAYVYRKLAPRDLILIRWLGHRDPAERPAPAVLGQDGAITVLNTLQGAWDQTRSYPELRKEIAEGTAAIVRSRAWQPQYVTFLEEMRKLLASDFPDQALTIRAAEVTTIWHAVLLGTLLLLAAHLCVWLLLLLAYPRWPWGLGFFFWNRWVRRILGLGYVGALIRLMPWMRRWMLVPFRVSLLPQDLLEQLKELTYFVDCEVVPEINGRREPARVPVSEVLGSIRGQVVVKAQSGLGKTLLLLRLALVARVPVVYLKATECAAGVVAAVQKKLHARVRDERYLRALIGAGALKVLIDDFNEAALETRSRITQFVEKYPGVDFILTTQATSWEPPSNVRVYLLQPLRPEQIEPFLLQQWASLKAEATLDEKQYEDAVSQYVASQVSDTPDVRLVVLSNPIDARLAAEVLARGTTPDTLRLLAQRYHLVAESFKEVQDRPFPLREFSERVYEWRSSGEPYPSMEGFEAETAALAQDHLMIQRVYVIRMERDEQEVSRWSFRHERIMDFFLLPAFLDEEKSARRYEHAQDERFSGVYELLAVWLPDNEAAKLHGSLMAKAADTNQNDLLNRYALARRARRGPIVHSTPPLALPRALSHEGQPTDQGSPSAAPSGEAATSVESPASPALQE